MESTEVGEPPANIASWTRLLGSADGSGRRPARSPPTSGCAVTLSNILCRLRDMSEANVTFSAVSVSFKPSVRPGL